MTTKPTKIPFPEGKWKKQIQNCVQEVYQHESSLLQKIAHVILPTGTPDLKKQNSHVDGSVVGKAYPTPEVTDLVNHLYSHPTAIPERARLIAHVFHAKKQHSLTTHHNLLIQSLLPLYLGYFDQKTFFLFIKVYQSYLHKLIAAHKSKLLGIRSSLKGFDYTKISVDRSMSANSSKELKLIIEIRMSENLLKGAKRAERKLRKELQFRPRKFFIK